MNKNPIPPKNSHEHMVKIAKMPKRRKMVVRARHVADACKLKKSTIDAAVRDKRLDLDNLKSIAYFIVKRTLNVPVELD